MINKLKIEKSNKNFEYKNFYIQKDFVIFRNENNEIVAVSSGWTHYDGNYPVALGVYEMKDAEEGYMVHWVFEDDYDSEYPVTEVFQLLDIRELEENDEDWED